jgi:hypothetical protein
LHPFWSVTHTITLTSSIESRVNALCGVLTRGADRSAQALTGVKNPVRQTL